MASGGRYADESVTQHGAAAFGFPLIEPAIEALQPPEHGPLLLADFGAAQGTNSLEAMRRALAALERRVSGRPAFVIHADIPGNDFTTLCETLETSPARYTLDRPDVLPLMAGRSLYDRMLPPATLSFGWTASTLHWLRQAPGPIDDHFFVQLSHDAAARAAYAEQSANDWRDFLDHRAAELIPGAGIVIVDVAMGDDGTMGSEALFDRLNEALVECRDSGQLSPEEFARIVYPTWFRSLAELRAPFEPHHVAPGGEALELVAVRPVVFEDPFRAAFEETGDAGVYARAQAGFLEGFLAPSFAAALDGERPGALDAVWSAARRLIAADPLAVSPRYRLFTALVRRVA